MADPLDVLTLPEGRRALNKDETNTENDDLIAEQITAVSRRLDARCGPVVQREIEAELIDGDTPAISLAHRPVASITLVREAYGSDVQTITPVGFGEDTGTGYRALRWAQDPSLLSGALQRLGGGYWACGVEVTYIAGRYETTEDVDARFKSCAASILRRLWKREAGTWGQAVNIFEADDATAGTGFFRVADPLIDEMLAADRQLATCA